MESLVMEADLLDEEINGSIWNDCFVNGIFAMSGTIHHLGVQGLGDISLEMLQECFEVTGRLGRNPMGSVRSFECNWKFLTSMGEFHSFFSLLPMIEKIHCNDFDPIYSLEHCHLVTMASKFLEQFGDGECDR